MSLLRLPYLHSSCRVMYADQTQTSVESVRRLDTLQGLDGGPVRVLENVKLSPPRSEFVRFGEGSLGRNIPLPSPDLFIHQSSMIHHNQKVIDAENLINGNSISRVTTERPANAFVLVTEHGEAVQVNGISLATVSLKEWCRAPFDPNQVFSVFGNNKRGEACWRALKYKEIVIAPEEEAISKR